MPSVNHPTPLYSRGPALGVRQIRIGGDLCSNCLIRRSFSCRAVAGTADGYSHRTHQRERDKERCLFMEASNNTGLIDGAPGLLQSFFSIAHEHPLFLQRTLRSVLREPDDVFLRNR